MHWFGQVSWRKGADGGSPFGRDVILQLAALTKAVVGITSERRLFCRRYDGDDVRLLGGSETFRQVCASHDGHFALALSDAGRVLQWDLQDATTTTLLSMDEAAVVPGLQEHDVVKVDAGSGHL